jgi:DNA-binding MarR family transcriptional regulator
MDGAEQHGWGIADGAGYTNKKPKLTIMSEKEKTELAVDLGRAVAEMRNHINYLLQEKITQHAPHISFEMVEILACLWKEDGVNQQQLAALTVKDKSSITHLVAKLERELLVSRIGDERDRRNKLVFLTPAGRQLRKKLYPWVLEVYEQAVAGISGEEIDGCLSLIKKITENVQLTVS